MQSTPNVLKHGPVHDISDPFLLNNSRPGRRPKTILLVDDDDILRMVMEAGLTLAGYRIIACSDARKASAAFRSCQVDVLLTDLQMPGKSGVELALELTEVDPKLPVLIISASLIQEELASAIQDRGWSFLAKPCRPNVLLQTLALLSSVQPNAA